MARKMLVDGEVDKATAEEANYDFDLFVIGAGSGGVRAARFSANHGAKVGICELPFHPISSEEIGGVGGTTKLGALSRLVSRVSKASHGRRTKEI